MTELCYGLLSHNEEQLQVLSSAIGQICIVGYGERHKHLDGDGQFCGYRYARSKLTYNPQTSILSVQLSKDHIPKVWDKTKTPTLDKIVK